MRGWQSTVVISPNRRIEVPLTRGQVAIIDADDLDLISGRSWIAQRRTDGNGFYAVAYGGVRMHRLILAVGDNGIVDHRDGNGLHNWRSNIRLGNQSLNSVNRITTPGTHLRGASPVHNRWVSRIKIEGKMVVLGRFDTELEAHEKYLEVARVRYGDWLPNQFAETAVSP